MKISDSAIATAPVGVRLPQLQIEYVPLQRLRLDPRNARKHSRKQIQQIARSIQAFGFNVPVLIDSTRSIIAGHGRVEAARSLGIEQVPAISLEHLSLMQRRAFMLADNRLTEIATWDERMLGEELQLLAAADLEFSIEATGFEMGEIDVYIEGLSLNEGDHDDDTADSVFTDAAKQITQAGDVWKLANHRILCGNALDLRSFEVLCRKEHAEMVFADPPYNVPIDGYATGTGTGKVHHREFVMATGEMTDAEFQDFLQTALRYCVEFASEGSIHYICMDWRGIGNLIDAGKEVYSELKNICVWCKDRAGQGSFYRSQHELVAVFKSGWAPHRNNIQLGSMGRYRTNVWRYPSALSFSRTSSEGNLFELHPTVKPLNLVADAILDCTARGSIVLDPFLGSGTCLIAAEKTGRRCYGLELDPLYVDVAIRRWQSLTGGRATRERDGASFVDVEKTLYGEQ